MYLRRSKYLNKLSGFDRLFISLCPFIFSVHPFARSSVRSYAKTAYVSSLSPNSLYSPKIFGSTEILSQKNRTIDDTDKPTVIVWLQYNL